MLRLTAVSLILAALGFVGARAGYVIKGQVQDERGEAACGVMVCAHIEGFDPKKPHVPVPCGWTNVRGEFAINVGGPGKYTLYYDHSEVGYFSPYVPFFRHPSAPAPEVLLDEAHASSSVNISLPPKNGVLAGQGVDAETGRPVDDFKFVLCHADAPGICWGKSIKNPKGEFKIPAAYVPFTVRVSAEGYEEWFGPHGGDSRAPLSVAPETTVELSVRLKRSAASAGRALAEGEKVEGVHLPAPSQKAPAEGAVFDHYPRRTRLEWAPVEGAVSYTVEVDLCSGRRKDAQGCVSPQPLRMTSNPPTSGIEGTSYEFEFIGMQPGRWRVWAVDASGREGFKSPWRRFVYLQ